MEPGVLKGVRSRSARCLGSALIAVCALAISSCAITSEPSTPGASSDTSGRTAGSLDRSGLQQLDGARQVVFPLTVVRTGGVAGFDDHLVLEANGRMHVDSRSVRGRVCFLTTTQQRLLTLLAISPVDNVSTRSAPSTSVGGSQAVGDDEQSTPLVLTVVDGQSRLIDLDHSSSAEVHDLLDALLGDVTLSSPTSTRCTTTPAAPSQAEHQTGSVTSHG